MLRLYPQKGRNRVPEEVLLLHFTTLANRYYNDIHVYRQVVPFARENAPPAGLCRDVGADLMTPGSAHNAILPRPPHGLCHSSTRRYMPAGDRLDLVKT